MTSTPSISRPSVSPASPIPARGGSDVIVTVFSNLIVFAVILLGVNLFDVFDRPFANVAIPSALLATCLWGVYKLIRRRPITTLTCYPWLLLAIGLFHGFGSLAPIFANRATRDYINDSFLLTEDRLHQTATLNLVGFVGISVGILLGHALRRTRNRPADSTSKIKLDLNTITRLGKLSLLVGLPVLLFVRVPQQLGMFSFFVPSSIMQLATFVQVSLIIFSYLAEQGRQGARSVLAILIPLLLVIELLTFAKEAVIMVTMMPFLGSYLACRKLSRLAWGGVMCAAVFVFLVPVVGEGRRQMSAREREVVGQFGVPLDQRWEIFTQAVETKWFSNTQIVTTESKYQIWWSRLCYNNVQAFAMSQYDAGSPGNSLRDALATFVPRALWPNKPVTAMLGIEFQQLYTGRWFDNRTSIGIGIFGEGYWLGGWWGVLIVTILIGLQMAIFSNLVFLHEQRGDFMAFIFCFLYAINTARSIDKWIVMAFVGNIPIFIALYFFSSFVAHSSTRRSVVSRLHAT